MVFDSSTDLCEAATLFKFKLGAVVDIEFSVHQHAKNVEVHRSNSAGPRFRGCNSEMNVELFHSELSGVN